MKVTTICCFTRNLSLHTVLLTGVYNNIILINNSSVNQQTSLNTAWTSSFKMGLQLCRKVEFPEFHVYFLKYNLLFPTRQEVQSAPNFSLQCHPLSETIMLIILCMSLINITKQHYDREFSVAPVVIK